MIQTKLLGIIMAIALFSGLAIATPMLTVEATSQGNDDKDSPSDGDQGYGNDPGKSGDAHKKNNKRD